VIHHHSAVLISDLHLSESRPDLIQAFLEFIESVASQHEALFILGDFFEYWVGDDATNPMHDEIAHRLKALGNSTAVYLMVGNRDFALGDDYAHLCGATLLPDPTLVELSGKTWLLSHGDALCTDDKGYQRYRKFIQNPWILRMLRRLPLGWRLSLAEKLRQASRTRDQGTKPRHVDVNQRAVEQLLRGTRSAGLIHGHTHMADWHLVKFRHEATRERLVLGDWDKVGWYLYVGPEGKTLNRFSPTQFIFSTPPARQSPAS